MIDAIMNNPSYENDDQRAADISLAIIAGHDTTAYTIAWTLKELAMKPHLQSELRDELRAGGDTALRRCIREAMRLHPVAAAGSIRKVGRDFHTKDGKLIPRGSYAFLSLILPLRDPDIFGTTANEYCPDRWDDPTPDMNQAFFPFSLGKQNCAGQPLANAELHSILPRILSNFEFTIVEPGTSAYFLTLKPVGTILKATPLSSM